MDTEDKKINRFIKIRYKDEHDRLQEAVRRLEGEWLRETVSERENIEIVASIILIDDGAFWLNTTTLIPSHRICSFHMHSLEKDTPDSAPAPKSKHRRRPPKKKPLKEN
ncbi:MAG: hypothetical protein D4S01_01905 [Dehalococcoidia bacterium]|nr:MAG: hypothetical protein D4S01_01905 [Dehalococcoidia bacterium]